MKILFALFISLFLTGPALFFAQSSTSSDDSGYTPESEYIDTYHVFIKVETNGSLLIEETISVYAASININHGIYRDIPFTKRLANGFNRVYPITIVAILKDGKEEPYHVEDNMGNTRIYLGSEDIYLTPGLYEYKIVYRIDEALNFNSDYTELYWNAIGTEWIFAINSASILIHLPGGAGDKLISHDAYIGHYGETFTNYTFERIGDILKYTADDAFQPETGFTVMTRWPNGIVAPPDEDQKFMKLFRDNTGFFVITAGIFLIMIYYIVMWFIAGRDPKKGSIMTYFDPPENLSPGAMRYILGMKYDPKIFSTTIISLAVKGKIQITEDREKYKLVVTTDTLSGMTDEEKAVFNALFSGRRSIDVDNAYHSEFAEAINKCKSTLKTRYEITYFVQNRHIFIPGLILTIIVVFTGVLLFSANFIAAFVLGWLSFWTFGVAVLIKSVGQVWIDAFTSTQKKGSKFAGAIGMTLFSSVFVAGEIVGIVILFFVMNTSYWLLPVCIIAILINYIFYRLLKAPTLAGRALMDKIEGFRMYIGAAEKGRIEVLNPPAKDIATFEKFLPYALTFDMEKNWAGYFHDVLEAAKQGPSSYSPSWYNGSSFSSSDFGSFTSSIGSGLTSALSSASTSPSSGGGGGGSSGGGGGGGGGGGW
ncbi:MAG: hypothetical protein A2Y33_02285 [Spirochaetes bacterium GWF1_51_8]|nr:MAG: hypothetical protein A2Y33_02285 [Spirochaetes bacterium GWF1_51_8]